MFAVEIFWSKSTMDLFIHMYIFLKWYIVILCKIYFLILLEHRGTSPRDNAGLKQAFRVYSGRSHNFWKINMLFDQDSNRDLVS